MVYIYNVQIVSSPSLPLSSEKGRQSCSAGVWEDLLPRSGGARGKVTNIKAAYTHTLSVRLLGTAS